MACFHRLRHAAGERVQYSPPASARLEPAIIGRVDGRIINLRTRRYSIITAGHAPLVQGRRFSVHVPYGAGGRRGVAGSVQPFAQFEVLMADRLQRGG
jgi:hypothetical protein